MRNDGESLHLERNGKTVRFRIGPPYLTANALVATRLREAIERGELRSGDKLPSQDDIGEKLGVSRGPVGTALSKLRDEGLLSGGQGARWSVT